MKRIVLLILILSFSLSCIACSGIDEERIAFYYLRTAETIQYGESDGLIAPVAQDISGDSQLDALLQRYLKGPGDENYRNPFPRGTYLLSTILQEDTLILVLSREFSTLDGIQLTLAGACLTATCYDLTGLEKVQVRSGENVYDFNFNDHIFLDTAAGK